MIQEFPIWVYAQKKLKQGLKTSICTPTFIIALWWLPGTHGMAAWGDGDLMSIGHRVFQLRKMKTF